MESFLNLIHCCKKNDVLKNQSKSEVNIPVDNQQIKYKKTQKIQLSSDNNEKYNDINNTNNSYNENNNLNNNTTEENSFNNTNSNLNRSQNMQNQSQDIFQKSDTIAIKNQSLKDSNSPKRIKDNYDPVMSNNHMNINKIINNNSSKNVANNVFMEAKKQSSSSMISKKNSKIIKENSNKDTILTLNDLILINQNQEEKVTEMGSKLLLSGELFFWKEIIIQTNGIKNSLRKEKDDHVFFGIKNKSNYAGAMFNDLIINFFWHQEDVDIVETNTGRVFEIYYNKITKDYTLKFIHPNLMLYYKINNFVYFNTGKEYYLFLGSVFIIINVKKTSPIEKTIVVQIENENNKPTKYSFSQNQVPIKIGRISNSDIPIFHSSISKRHAIIEFSKNSQTFYFKDMGSTNSSTLLIKEGDNLKIKGEMNFKLEDVPFKIQEIP
jgi:hypothetical protein